MTRAVLLVGLLLLALIGATVVIWQKAQEPEADGTLTVIVPHEPPSAPTTASPSSQSPSTAETSQAELVAQKGAVQVRGPGGVWRVAGANEKLSADDAVRTGRNAEATLRVGDGVEVRLSPRSEFTMRELTSRVSKIRLEEGHVTATVDGAGRRVLRVQARGTDAEAESAGGQFGIVSDGKGQLAVATSTGKVTLSAGGATVDVAAGETSRVTEAGTPAAPQAIPASLFLSVAQLSTTKTNQRSTVVSGTTSPGSVVQVGDQVAHADDRGAFTLRVPLRDGENVLAVDVVDATGRKKTEALPAITVDREKPKIEAETTWGSNSAAPQ